MRLADIITTCFIRGSVRMEPDQIYLAMTKDELVELLKTAEVDGFLRGYRKGSGDGYAEGYQDGYYDGMNEYEPTY